MSAEEDILGLAAGDVLANADAEFRERIRAAVEDPALVTELRVRFKEWLAAHGGAVKADAAARKAISDIVYEVLAEHTGIDPAVRL